MHKKIIIVKKRVNEEPNAIEIDNTLLAMQKIVGGYIETVSLYIGRQKYLLVCNEEGKIKGLAINIVLPGDTINGNIFISADDGIDDFRSLKTNELPRIIDWLNLKAKKYRE